MEKKSIKIVGAGLSGLTSAINLAKAGFKVEVYEKSSKVGEHYKENAQLLPNWFSKEDVIEELEKCNIKINWVEKIEEVEIRLPKQKIIFFGKRIPIGYAVLRGGENSLEKDLALQAESLGVKIITDFLWDANKSQEFKPDIIATGFSQPITLGYGQVFKGEFEPKKVKVFFDPYYASSISYGYLFPHNKNLATVKISKPFGEEKMNPSPLQAAGYPAVCGTSSFCGYSAAETNLKENLERLERDYLTKEIKKENFLYDFGTKRSFQIPKSAILDQSLLVGETAGFQDELFRFGMRYAIISGYLAAKAIIEDLNYDELWKQRFMKEFQRTKRVRRVFEDLKKRNFANFPEKSDLSMDMEKFKKLWLSKKFNFLLAFYPLYRWLISRLPIPSSLIDFLSKK